MHVTGNAFSQFFKKLVALPDKSYSKPTIHKCSNLIQNSTFQYAVMARFWKSKSGTFL